MLIKFQKSVRILQHGSDLNLIHVAEKDSNYI